MEIESIEDQLNALSEKKLRWLLAAMLATDRVKPWAVQQSIDFVKDLSE